MNIGRREFLQLAGIVTALSSTIRQASAQAYPTQPIRLIAPFPAGQAADNIARLMAQALSDRLGQQVIVENRPGASGNIGTELVTKAEPDGYTLLMEVVTSIVINTSLYPHLNFDFIRDIAPVANIGAGVYVLVVNPEVPAKTLPEFITYAKANPGAINMVSAGIGTPPHAFGALFMTMTGIDMVHVPYSASYMADLIGGRVQVMFSPMPTTIQQIRAGQLRALAVTTKTRSELMPDLPTIGEFVPGYEADGQFGIGAPSRTPKEIIEKLNREINASLGDPAVRARLVGLGVEPMPMTPAEFAKSIAVETEKWAKVVKATGMKVE